jgi:hypothetical protein
MPKREVKEEPEYAMQPAIRRSGGSSVKIREPAWQQQRRASGTLLDPKPEEKDNEESAKAAQMVEYERR